MNEQARFWRKCLQCICQGFSIISSLTFPILRNRKTEMKKQKDVTLRRQLCYWVFHSDSPLVGYTWTIFSFCWIKNTFDGYTWNIFSFCRIEKYLHESVSGFSSRHVFFELLLPVQSIIDKFYLDIIF